MKVGSMVCIHEDANIKIDEYNPLFVDGVVFDVKGGFIGVEWPTGSRNYYHESDLVEVMTLKERIVYSASVIAICVGALLLATILGWSVA